MRITFFEQEQTETVVDLLHEMSGHYNGGRPSDRAHIRENLQKNILGPLSGVRLLLAVDDGRAVALASVAVLYPALRERGQLFLKELFVVSSHRGRGIGTVIIRHLAEFALANDCVRLDWTVDRNNWRALEFYDKLGAKPAPDKIYFRVADEGLSVLAGMHNGALDVG
jgi:GNAT superfamily N-acetyltransferase